MMSMAILKRTLQKVGRLAIHIGKNVGLIDVRPGNPPALHSDRDIETDIADAEAGAGPKHGEDGSRRPPRVLMLGLRGLPNVQGGVEKHVEQLALQLLKSHWAVDVIGRIPYVKRSKHYIWNGIRIVPVWAPSSPKLEAIVHTFFGVFLAARLRPDILHIHAIGPSMLAPLARLLGLNVVVTHHGFDYNREKWGVVARTALRVGEYFGMNFAHGRIAVSKNIAETMEKQYSVPVKFIPNGVAAACDAPDTSILGAFELTSKRYILMVSRIVPEKRQLDLIDAFLRLELPDLKLVIVGNADKGSPYLDKVMSAAARTPNVVCTGLQTGDDLATLYRNAAFFCLPSSHEGMPIVVLEALAYRVPVIVSDIPANLALGLHSDDYFPAGDVAALSRAIDAKLKTLSIEENNPQEGRVATSFSWTDVCEETLDLYWEVLDKKTSGSYSGISPKYKSVG